MLRIFDSLKSLISPELVSRAADIIGEDNSKVSSAVSPIIAGLLGALLHKGDSTQVKNALTDAGKYNLLSDVKSIFAEPATAKHQNVGDNFLQSILGSKVSDFGLAVASGTGLTATGANHLTSMIAPVVAGYLGSKLSTNGMSFSNLLSQIKEEKNTFVGYMPAGLAGILGVSSLSDLGNNISTTDRVTETKKEYYEPAPEKKGSGWWKWLLLVLLLLLLFWWWRSCNTDRDYVNVQETEVLRPDTVVNDRTDTYTAITRDTTSVLLPDGRRINVYRNGIEDQIVKYLQSDDYKNATASNLDEKWFDFDDIEFEFGSSTQLMGNSRGQVDNIVAILKSFPNAKVRIGGHADKVGSEDSNLTLSKRRAVTIENMLDKAGVGSQVVRTVGFGEEYAEHDADAPDNERAEDRIISLRFVK